MCTIFTRKDRSPIATAPRDVSSRVALKAAGSRKRCTWGWEGVCGLLIAVCGLLCGQTPQNLPCSGQHRVTQMGGHPIKKRHHSLVSSPVLHSFANLIPSATNTEAGLMKDSSNQELQVA